MPKTIFDERKIIEGILQGNEKALRFFYRHFSPSLFTYIKRKVENVSDAEEILQDTLLAVIEALRDFSHHSSLFTYICSIANHKVIDYYRKKKVKNIFFSKIPTAESLLATLWGPEDEFDDELLRQKIKDCFSQITPRYSLLLKLKYVYGYSVAEIAEKLAVSYKSAESQLFRARKAFIASFAPLSYEK